MRLKEAGEEERLGVSRMTIISLCVHFLHVSGSLNIGVFLVIVRC